MATVVPSYLVTGEWGLCDVDDASPPRQRSSHSAKSSSTDVAASVSVRATKNSDAGAKKYSSSVSSSPEPSSRKASRVAPRSESKKDSFRSRISANDVASSPRKQNGDKSQRMRSVVSFLEGDGLGELPVPSVRKETSSTLSSSRKHSKAPAVPQNVARPFSGEISDWVAEYLTAAGLEWACGHFKQFNFELHLLPYLDPVQVEDLLAASTVDPMDKIKLSCALRAMKVQIQAQTQDETSRGLTRPASQSPLLENPDVVTWTAETVAKWFSSVPTLAHLSETFLVNGIDGKTLLRLNDRKMLINLRLASPIDRRLLLQHISDLKSLQLANASIAHKDVVDKLVQGLGSELEQLRVSAAATAASAPTHSASSSSATKSSSSKSSNNDNGTTYSLCLSTSSSSTNSTNSSAVSTPRKSSSLVSASIDNSKKSPNFFLSLRISSQDIQNRVREIQEFIQDRIPSLRGSKCILPPEQLHFTLGRLHLYSEEEQEHAKEVLERCSRLVERFYKGKPVTATFKGIANHGGNALFVETEVGSERDLLTELGNSIFEEFRDAGLASRNFRFIPVAPIIRIHTSKKEAIPPLKELCQTLVPDSEEDVFGNFTFESVEISCVSSETQEDGYYKSLHSVAWGN